MISAPLQKAFMLLLRQGLWDPLLCLMTVGIGNTNVNFHHELAVEQAIRNHHYEAGRLFRPFSSG